MITQINDAAIDRNWYHIDPSSLGALKRRILAKHGTLTAARNRLRVNALTTLGDVLAGRSNHPAIVAAIQRDQGLSDDQVLELWPLLRAWPRRAS
jgi:acyl dehydratase